MAAVGPITIAPQPGTLDEQRALRDQSTLYTLNPDQDEEIKKLIDQVQRAGDTLGGIIEVRVEGVPFGLGSHTQWDKRLDGRLAQAVMAVQAIKGVEIGLGFEAARRRGSEVHDPIGYDPGQAGTPTLGFTRSRNNAGGLEAGMTQRAADRRPRREEAHQHPGPSASFGQLEDQASRSRPPTSGATSAPWRRQAASWRTSSPLKSPRRWSISSAATAWPRSRRDGNCSTKWRRRNWKMMQLHDKTRRRICLAAFFLLCLAPTALVAAWCVAWQLPGHKAAEIARLRQQTGLDVALAGLRHPRPGTVLYQGTDALRSGDGANRAPLPAAGGHLDPRRRRAGTGRRPSSSLSASQARDRSGRRASPRTTAGPHLAEPRRLGATWNFACSAGQLTLRCRRRPADAPRRRGGHRSDPRRRPGPQPSFACAGPANAAAAAGFA